MEEMHNQPMPSERKSALAITGFVLSLLGILTCFTAIPGVILSAIGWQKAGASPETHGGKGLAIAGVVVGGVSLLLGLLSVPLLVAVMLPAIAQARQSAHEAMSMAHARAITQGLIAYSADYDNALPPPDADWVALLIDGGHVQPELFVSPSAEDESVVSYHYVPAPQLTSEPTQPLVYETPDLRARPGAIVGFHDSRVEVLDGPTFEALLEIIGEQALERGDDAALPPLDPPPAP